MIKETLAQYNIKNPSVEFIRYNENVTYKITDKNDKYLLRIHKPINN